MAMALQFLGANNSVTGSRTRVLVGHKNYLVDCGLYQGYKYLRQRNWRDPDFDPKELDGVLLTHAHIDHSGYLPRLAHLGFEGPVFSSQASADLCELLLPDAAHLQEEEALFRNRHQLTRHQPALPLYTVADAHKVLGQFHSQPFDKPLHLGEMEVTFRPAGHILGASSLLLDGAGRRVLFSGDLGSSRDPFCYPPAPPPQDLDYVVIESTYGDRLRPENNAKQDLADAVNDCANRGGTLLIPSFAVGRAQLIMHLLTELIEERRIPDLPLYLDSPMAVDASQLYCKHHHLHRLSDAQCKAMCHKVHCTRSVEESIALGQNVYPKVIISASGMATGGRVVHHLKNLLPHPRNLVLFVGYQAGGTRGARLLEGERHVKIHGQQIPVAAEIRNIEGLSAHADQQELIDWLKQLKRPPVEVLINHGEEQASDTLRLRIEEELGWAVRVPEYGERIKLR